ncbi:MAG: tail fiber domain-containing protein [Kofleriaceae bacterium]
MTGRTELGPEFALAKRLSTLEGIVRGLSTRDVLQNASIGAGGLTITDGGSLTVDGDATFNGSLTVPAGSLNTGGNLSAGGSITAGTSLNAPTANIGAGGLGVTSGIVAGGNLSVAGAASVGPLTVTGDQNITGDIYTPHGRATPVVTGYVSAYLDSVGRLGATPSSARFKQDIEPFDFAADVAALKRLALVRYKMTEAVELYGDAAPWEHGTIAEYAWKSGLHRWVALDADGEPFSVRYERLTIPIIAWVQQIEERLALAGL